MDILIKNKEKLILFLQNFQNEKGAAVAGTFSIVHIHLAYVELAEDDQFKDEKAFLLKQIQQLEPQ